MVETSKDSRKCVTFGLPDSLNLHAISNDFSQANHDALPMTLPTAKVSTPCSTTYSVARPEALDIASVKVVELSKRLRELMACLLTERTKSRQLEDRVRVLDAVIRDSRKLTNVDSTQSLRLSINQTGGESGNSEQQNLSTKGTLEKLARSEEIIKTLRNENHTLKSDLREAKRVLELETGEKIDNINLWLRTLLAERGGSSDRRGRSGGGWRGRQQQISLLRSKVKSLESRLNSLSPLPFHLNTNRNDELESVYTARKSGATTLGIESIFAESDFELPLTQKQSATDRSKIAVLEKEITKLNDEIQTSKSRFAKAKARENSLSVEMQELKKKMVQLLEKGKHDDELITAMIDSNQKLQDTVKQKQEEIEQLQQNFRSETEKLISSSLQKGSELEKLKKILFQKDDEIRELENMIRDNQSVSSCTEGQKSMSNTTTSQGGLCEDKSLDEATQKLKKQTRLTQIECDGMKKLVESLNDRVDLLLQENANLKYELSLKNSEDFAQLSNQHLSNHEQNKRGTVITKTTTETGPDEKRNCASKKRNKTELERLLNRQFLVDTLSKCSLNAASANTVSKQMGLLQSALSDSYKEIESLRELREKLRSVRREDFNLLSEIVRQLRVASENDEL